MSDKSDNLFWVWFLDMDMDGDMELMMHNFWKGELLKVNTSWLLVLWSPLSDIKGLRGLWSMFF